MSRPRKPRFIYHMPKYLVFGPKGYMHKDLEEVILLIDEFEVIRLIDHLDYNQEEAATQMNVARTTVQRIYTDARKKIATALVEGKMIVIEGGDVKFCDDEGERNFRPQKRRRHGRNFPKIESD